MRIIAITTPKVIDEDVCIITALLNRGVDIVHLRKPDSNIDECRELLAKPNACTSPSRDDRTCFHNGARSGPSKREYYHS